MAGVNKITRSVSPKSIFPSALAVISSSVSFNQGDLLVFDDTNNVLKKPAAETEGLTFLGMAQCTIVSGKLAKPYTTDVDASSAITDIPGPVYGVIAKVILKNADVIAPGDLVFLDPANGTRNVSVTGTKAIGIYVGAAFTGNGTSEIEVHLGCRHPADQLKF